MVLYKFSIAASVLEGIILILFGIFVHYHTLADGDAGEEAAIEATAENSKYYAVFQDINVMMFVGFAFLMVFLRKGGFTSVGYTFFVTAYVIQASILWRHFFHCAIKKHWVHLELGYDQLINGLYASGSLLISLGAYLGKATPFQFLIIATVEVIFYCLNETILYALLVIADVGGSIVIHTFGAYFGLAVSFFISNKDNYNKSEHDNGSTKQSDTLALIGTVFLWMFWPSFNCAIPVNGSQVMRTIINTIMSLTGSCMATFIATSFLHHGYFNIVDVQNATLAGGVSIGAIADLNIGIWGALLVGNIAGWISTIGYRFLQPKMKRVDTCGVNNLHGMTGVFGGIASVIAVLVIKGYSVTQRAGIYGDAAQRTNGKQAGVQFGGLLIALIFALGSGALTGLLAKKADEAEVFFKDEIAWEEETEDTDTLSAVSKDSKISLPMSPPRLSE
jgi:ammonium transporter Rh